MLESSLVYIIARTFPESLIMVLSGMILLDIDIKISKVIKTGICFGCVVAIIRMLPINFGVHTVLSMISFGLILFKISKKDVMKSMLTTCVVWIALALSESIYILIAMGIFNVPMDILTNTRSLEAALKTLPSLLIAFFIVMLFNTIRKKIVRKGVRG
ncbi:MAG: hypothetical protein ACRDA3_08190 [Peptostreptococcaceae bacterium]